MALRHRLIGRAARLYWRVRKPRTLGVRAVVVDPREIAEARWFPVEALPHDASPATARRIADYRRGVVASGNW